MSASEIAHSIKSIQGWDALVEGARAGSGLTVLGPHGSGAALLSGACVFACDPNGSECESNSDCCSDCCDGTNTGFEVLYFCEEEEDCE